MDTATKALYVAITSALFSGITVIITIWKFTIERKKFLLEIEKLNRDLKRVELNAYESAQAKEVIIYEGRKDDIEADFTGGPYYAWSEEKKGFLDIMGQGSYSAKNGIIDIQRSNIEGRYSIHLNSYNYGNAVQKIPIDKAISGKRKIKVTCDVKSIGAKHTLSFIFKADNQQVFDHKNYTVFKDTWSKLELAFSISTDDNCFLRIDDIDITKAPSSVQIKNIVVYEKIG